jgi:hypothetical protein
MPPTDRQTWQMLEGMITSWEMSAAPNVMLKSLPTVTPVTPSNKHTENAGIWNIIYRVLQKFLRTSPFAGFKIDYNAYIVRYRRFCYVRTDTFRRQLLSHTEQYLKYEAPSRRGTGCIFDDLRQPRRTKTYTRRDMPTAASAPIGTTKATHCIVTDVLGLPYEVSYIC